MDIRDRLHNLHLEENKFNCELSEIDKTIKQLKLKKIRLAKKISKNMKYRNILISRLK